MVSRAGSSKPVSPVIPGIAVVTGSLLSGAMFGHLLAIPIFLDTQTAASELVTLWARNYHYGHLLMPPIAVATFVIYAYAILRRRQAKLAWKGFLAAGLITVTIIPYTLYFMAATNATLFGWNDGFKAIINTGNSVASLEEARTVVAKWGWYHAGRSIMPLVGAAIGVRNLIAELLTTPRMGSVGIQEKELEI